MVSILGFKLNPNLYLRDPQSTELGQNIIQHSIKIIEKIGFDEFTFKKLGTEMGSPEASVYRYFENKHRLLLYLIDWYWTWLDYRIDYQNQNIESPQQRLRNTIKMLVDKKKSDPEIPFVDAQMLQRIVHSEFEKTYLTKQVDADNKEGLFLPYKGLCKKIGQIIKEINPKYAYPQSLASTIMLSATHQLYYAQHLPSLTNIRKDSKQKFTEMAEFLESLVMQTLNIKDR